MEIDWQGVVKTLGSATVLVAAIGYVIKSFITHLTKGHLLRTKSDHARKERIREELLRWSNPILGSVKELRDRLKNILEDEGYLALSSNYRNNIDPNWSITHVYFLSSTVYLFCQYFCYLELLREQLRFEIFQDHEEKDNFFRKSGEVGRALSSFPHKALDSLPQEGDMQVFRLQQRMLGEIVTVRDGDVDRCMRYSEFVPKWNEPNSNGAFEPLVMFLKDLSETDMRRWGRLELMKTALDDLYEACKLLIYPSRD